MAIWHEHLSRFMLIGLVGSFSPKRKVCNSLYERHMSLDTTHSQEVRVVINDLLSHQSSD